MLHVASESTTSQPRGEYVAVPVRFDEVADVAHKLGLTPAQVRRLANAGILPVAGTTGRRSRLFQPADVDRLREARARQADARRR
jgi:hypothetical protein